MAVNLDQLLISIFTGIVIAPISSWITVKLSLRKFRVQKIWNKKIDAYLKIIESLHHIKEFTYDEKNFLLGVNENKSYIIKKYKFSLEELLKYKNMGSLIITEKAVQELVHFQNKLEESEINNINKNLDPIEHLKVVTQITEQCLKNIIYIAKYDLIL